LRKVVRVSPASASERVEELLERTPCPRCDHLEKAFRPVLTAKLVILGLVVASACFVEGMDGDMLWRGAGLVCLGATGVLFWRSLAVASFLRQTTVEFSEEPPPVPQIAGTTCIACDGRIVTAAAGIACPECQATVHIENCAQRHAAGAHGPAAGSSAYRQ
jgi:hypothetical protein